MEALPNNSKTTRSSRESPIEDAKTESLLAKLSIFLGATSKAIELKLSTLTRPLSLLKSLLNKIAELLCRVKKFAQFPTTAPLCGSLPTLQFRSPSTKL